MWPRLPLERAGQVLQPRLLLADGAATQRLERRQLVQLLSVDPVCLLRDDGEENVNRGHGSRFARVRGRDYGGQSLAAKTIHLQLSY